MGQCNPVQCLGLGAHIASMPIMPYTPEERQGCPCTKLASPRALEGCIPSAHLLQGSSGGRTCSSDMKVFLANYAKICIPGAMPPWFMDTVSLLQGFKKPSTTSACPWLQEHEMLEWFPDTPCQCIGWEEHQASHTGWECHHAPALSGLTASSVTASPHLCCSWSLDDLREGFPPAL